MTAASDAREGTVSAAISFFDSRLTGNIHLTASTGNAPAWSSGLGKSRSRRHGGQRPAFDKRYALRHYKKYEESHEVFKELYY